MLTLMSLFQQAGQPSELQTVLGYLDDRFDHLEQKLQLLLVSNASINRKVDALLIGQDAIFKTTIQNVRSIRATRVEIAHINQAISDLGMDISRLHEKVNERLTEAAKERQEYFDGLRDILQRQSLREVVPILTYWLRPSNGVVERLNSNNFDSDFIQHIRFQREKVVGLINDLSSSEFVYPANLLSGQPRLQDRPPAHLLSMLRKHGEHAAILSSYLKSISSGDIEPRMSDAEAQHLHDAAFPEPNLEFFSELLNPDILAFVLEHYLTFVLALTEEARQAVGFPEIEGIRNHIGKLSGSKKAAQQLVWPMLAAAIHGLDILAHQLRDDLEGASLLQLFGADNVKQWTDPVVLPDPSASIGRRDEQKSREEALRWLQSLVDMDVEALRWLQENGEVYFDFASAIPTLGTRWGAVDAIISKILREDPAWRIRDSDPGFEWMAHLTTWEVERTNLEALHVLRALYEAYRDGRLYAYASREDLEEDLKFRDELVSKPLLQVTREDLEKFVGLIRSDAELLRFAEKQGLIHMVLSGDDRVVDANGDEDGKAIPIGKVQYFNYHTEAYPPAPKRYIDMRLFKLPYGGFQAKQDFHCLGAKILAVPSSRRRTIVPQTIAFPLDRNGKLGDPGSDFDPNIVASCYNAALGESANDIDVVSAPLVFCPDDSKPCNITGLTIINFARSYKDEPDLFMSPEELRLTYPPHGHGLSEIHIRRILDTHHAVEDFIRNKFLVGDQTILFHRERSTCKVTAEWRVEHAFTKGVDPAQSIATIWQYVEARVDNPRIFSSQAVVDGYRKEWLHPDGSREEDFSHTCQWAGESHTYRTQPGMPLVSEPFPPFNLGASWKKVPNRQLDVVPGFRNAVVNILANRLKEMQRDQRASVGSSFRNSLRNFSEFHKAYPEDPNQIIAKMGAHLLLVAPSLLKVFAEWGLSDCLYEVPEYLPILGLLRERQNGTGPSLLEALAILKDDNRHDKYEDAAEAIMSARRTLQNRLKSASGFPPKPSHPAFGDKYAGIDQTAALELAQHRNCTPGHPSILDIEGHVKLMEEFRLLPVKPRKDRPLH